MTAYTEPTIQYGAAVTRAGGNCVGVTIFLSGFPSVSLTHWYCVDTVARTVKLFSPLGIPIHHSSFLHNKQNTVNSDNVGGVARCDNVGGGSGG